MELLTTLVITGVVSAVIQLAKKYKVIGNMGDYGIQLLVFGFAVVIALLQLGFNYLPAQYANAILTVMAGSICWYELIIKKFTNKG